MNIRETTDLSIANKILELFLNDCSISNFSYYMDAHIDFGRPYSKKINELVPRTFRIILPSVWRVEPENEWNKYINNEVRTFFGSEKEGPLRAFVLACLFSTRINGFDLGNNGDLQISTEKGETLFLQGKDEEEDESWALIIPDDVPNSELWYVSCDPIGVVHCKYPEHALNL